METEEGDFRACMGCGTTVSLAVDRAYAVGYADVLCMTCSLARGGIYDQRRDRWSVAPQVDDLLETPEPRVHGTR
jgi:hypothetical protein